MTVKVSSAVIFTSKIGYVKTGITSGSAFSTGEVAEAVFKRICPCLSMIQISLER